MIFFFIFLLLVRYCLGNYAPPKFVCGKSRTLFAMWNGLQHWFI